MGLAGAVGGDQVRGIGRRDAIEQDRAHGGGRSRKAKRRSIADIGGAVIRRLLDEAYAQSSDLPGKDGVVTQIVR
ncbi:hypothetical protein EDD84_31035 [Burkholderia gladioli]|nr:hypothetical protein EDD84_31035 [Burkholderia gladioli]